MNRILKLLVVVALAIISSCKGEKESDLNGSESVNILEGTEWISSNVDFWAISYPRSDARIRLYFASTEVTMNAEGTYISGGKNSSKIGNYRYSIDGNKVYISSFYSNGDGISLEFAGSSMRRTDGGDFIRTLSKQ